MTRWAIFLTVVILALSIAFAAMSAVVFAKREDYRDQLRKMTAMKEAIDAEAKTTKTKLEGERDAAVAKSGETTANLNALQLQFNTLHAENDRLGGQLTEAKSNFNRAEDKNLELTNLTKKLGDQVADMATANDKLKGERDDFFAKMSAERNRANQLEKANADLRDKLDTATASLKDATDTLKLNEDTFSELARHNIEAREIIIHLTKLPDIKGRVTYVDKASNSVALNVGRKQGVKKNYEFTIFRDSQFIAKVNVFNTEDELSLAQIVTTNLKHLPIQPGDTAATRLGQ
jgi:hypothetical protein